VGHVPQCPYLATPLNDEDGYDDGDDDDSNNNISIPQQSLSHPGWPLSIPHQILDFSR